MKHLLLITTSFPTVSDGREAAGSFVLDLCRELSQHIRLTIVAPDTARASVIEGLNVVWYPVPALPLSVLKPYRLADIPKILHTLKSGSDTVKKVIQKESIDHILCLWALPPGFWARRALKTNAIPYSTWSLGSDIWSLSRIPIVRGILKRVLRDSAVCFADGFKLCSEVEKISSRKCEFMPSSRLLEAVSNEEAKSGAAPFRLVFLGRWHKNKGVDLLLQALLNLHESDWQKIETVRIAGGGGLESEVHALVSELQRQERPVSLEGYKNKSEATILLKWADFVFIPSRIESIPVIFSDVVQLGKTIICTPVGDLPELIQRYNIGVLSDDVTVDSYTRAISGALDRKPGEFSENMAIAQSDFDIRKTAKTLLAELQLKNITVTI